MRRMSFMMTTRQILEQTKTVTRRLGWDDLQVGELVQPVEKCQGLRKGEHQRDLGCPIRCLARRRESLGRVTSEEVFLEGFPELSPTGFISMFCAANRGTKAYTRVNRIEFEYVTPIDRNAIP